MNLKKSIAKVTAGVMAFAMVATLAPSAVSNAAAKPKLSAKKVSVTVGATKKVTVKGKKIKKTTWSVKSKKIATISAKKKTSVKITGKKAGKTTVTAKVKVGSKTTKLTCTVTVKAKTVDNTTTAAPAPTTAAPAPTTAAPAPTSAAPVATTPAASATPVVEPTEEPTPEPEATPVVPEGDEYVVYPVEANLDDTLASAGTRYADVEWDAANKTVTWTSMDNYNTALPVYCVDGGKTLDVSDFDKLEIGFVCDPNTSTGVEAALKIWMAGATDFWGKKDAGFEGTDNLKNSDRTWTMNLSQLTDNGVDVSKLYAISVIPQNSKGSTITMKYFKFIKNTGDDYVSKDVAKKVTIKQEDGATKVAEAGNLSLLAEVTNKNNAKIDKAVTWASEDTETATVDKNGVVTGVKAGEVNITATVEAADGQPEVVGTYAVNVYNNDPASIVLFGEGHHTTYTLTELSGEGIELTANVLNSNGDKVAVCDTPVITVVSEGNTAGATVANEEGLNILKATSAGAATLELTSNDGQEKYTLAIEVVEGIRVPMTSATVYAAAEKAADAAITNFVFDATTGVATLKILDTCYNNGIGVNIADLGVLKEDLTVADIAGIYARVSQQQDYNYDSQIWVAKTGTADAITGCGTSWAAPITKVVKTSKVDTGYTYEFDSDLMLTAGVAGTETALNFAISSMYNNGITVSDIILVLKSEA